MNDNKVYVNKFSFLNLKSIGKIMLVIRLTGTFLFVVLFCNPPLAFEVALSKLTAPLFADTLDPKIFSCLKVYTLAF